MTKRKGNKWLARHLKDSYVKSSRADGYRARSAYKLLEIDNKEKLIKPGMLVVDLGAAPGGFCQVVADKLHGRGRIIAIDLLEMDALPEVEFIQGDFLEDETLDKLEQKLVNSKIDLILSDMAPNLSGEKDRDQARVMALAESVLLFCDNALKSGGNLLIKLFQGRDFPEFIIELRGVFTKVKTIKPKASRPESREVYVLATGYNKGKG